MKRDRSDRKLKAENATLRRQNQLLLELTGILKDEILGSHPAADCESASARAGSTPAAGKSRRHETVADRGPDENRKAR